jgi:hypothetical protein
MEKNTDQGDLISVPAGKKDGVFSLAFKSQLFVKIDLKKKKSSTMKNSLIKFRKNLV